MVVLTAVAACCLPVLVPRVKHLQGKGWTINVAYPEAQGAHAQDFNALVQRQIGADVADFKQGLSDRMPGSDWSMERETAVKLRVGNYASLYTTKFIVFGGAHPQQVASSLTYDFDAGRVVTLRDLFAPDSGYLQVISHYCTERLVQMGLAQDDWQSAAAPDPKNFKIWYLEPDALVIVFDYYQAGPYAAGRHEIAIPISELRDMANPRGPLALLH